jgi:hypothetical protein
MNCVELASSVNSRALLGSVNQQNWYSLGVASLGALSMPSDTLADARPQWAL